MKFVFLLLLAHFYSAQCSYKNNREWNDLKVTFSMNSSDPQAFQPMPRTVQDAVNRGWKRDVGCTEGFNGNRFILNGDRDVILIYDANGLIAGMARSTEKGELFNFPPKSLQSYFDDEGPYWTLSTYFTDPKKVCQKSLLGTWLWDGTGDRLVFGSKKATIEVSAFIRESEVNRTMWTQGKCALYMGQHYWLQSDGQLQKDSKRDNLLPFFLLFNKGKLNAFGWFWWTKTTSSKIELANPTGIASVMNPPPDWLFDSTQYSSLYSLHIYLDSSPSPRLNGCE